MQTIQLPFPVVQLQLVNNPDQIVVPILDNNVLWVKASAQILAGDFANAYQDKRLDKGEYTSLLDYQVRAEFEPRVIDITFQAPKQEIAYRTLHVQFDYYVQTTPKGWWCVVPALGIEAFVVEENEIAKIVEEQIRLDFMSHERLRLLQGVLTTIWFDAAKLTSPAVTLKTYTPNEVLRLNETKKKQLLPDIGQLIKTKKQTLFGYTEVLQQLATTLKGNYSKNVLLVGKSGVGKTSLVWELVRQQRKYDLNVRIWETTASTLIKELTGDMGWQENLALVCKELQERGDFLFVRNLLELFEVGQYQGNNVSMAAYLREYLSRGEITLITECTEEEFARIEARSPNYVNNFQVITITEPKEDQELEQIILQKVQQIAQNEKIAIAEEAIKETIRLNKRYTPYAGFPGKPIRFLESILIGSKSLQETLAKKEQEFVLDRSAVIQSFCEETGMPPFMVDPAIAMDLEQVKQFFLKNVFGQDHAVDTLTDILAAVKTALLRQGKPIASMLFVGPTGVGKTEMAKVLAEFMFGSRDKMLRFDMSEFSTPYAVARLTGSSYFSDGLLTSAVRREPFSVLLFDELEKAHPLFNDLLLQILGEGRLTDSQGKVVNFCSTIIIMTSNIGAKKAQNNSISWSEGQDNEQVAEHFLSEVQQFFRPEIYNRIDQVVPFYSLPKDVVKFVVTREIELFKKREGILHRNIDFMLEDSFLEFLSDKGYNPKYGARALQRSLREELIIPLSYQLNQYDYEDKLVITVAAAAGELSLQIEADPLKFDLVLEELTHNEYMDYASILRQNIFQLFEGTFYVRMLSELDMLERKKRRKSTQFWKNTAETNRYTEFLTLQEKFEAHKNQIELYEEEMALASMALTSINVQLYEKMEAWEAAYFDLKLELYQTLEPQGGEIYLGIYGKEVKRMYEFYEALLTQKNYEWIARSVWYRESEYAKTVEKENDSGEMVSVSAKEYVKQPFRLDDRNKWKPERSDDLLVGLEIKVKGIGVDLYLNEESGRHKIDLGDKQVFQYWVQADLFDFKTPAGIHRKNFFVKMPKARRLIAPNTIEDTVYKLPKRELKSKDRLPFLMKKMDKVFSRKLDALLF